MKYVLLLENGTSITYHVKAAAEIFQQILGGKIIEYKSTTLEHA